jgi:hypothetical protein
MEAMVTMGMIKAAIKGEAKGEIMIRQDKRFKGLEDTGVWTFAIYYTNPSPQEKKMITEEVREFGGTPYKHTNESFGRYGHRMLFRLGLEND